MTPEEYASSSAAELAHAVRTRVVRASTVVSAALRHIDATEPDTNAFIHIAEADARRQAERVDVRLAAGEDLPLAGVPVSVKDLVHVAGMVTTSGSRLSPNTLATEDAVPVARLRAAGAIIVGKTTTPEFGHKPVTAGRLFGETVNPWNRSFTCGGSSGGAAVSLARGQVPLAIGTDGGGSIRIPASVCGVVGLKATLGRIPHVHAPDLFANNSFIGPMARTVADTRLMYDVMAGPDARDPWSRIAAAPNRPPGRALRLGIAMTVGNEAVDPDVASAFDDAVAVLESLGHRTNAVDIDLADHERHFRVHLEAVLAGRFGDRIQGPDRGLLDESFIRTVENGMARTLAEISIATAARSELYRRFETLFESIDVLVTPTVAVASVPRDIDTHADLVIDGTDCGPIRRAWYPYTFPMNLTGHPAMSVPCGWSRFDLPIGIQLAGPWSGERVLLDLASDLEAGLDVAKTPPRSATMDP